MDNQIWVVVVILAIAALAALALYWRARRRKGAIIASAPVHTPRNGQGAGGGNS